MTKQEILAIKTEWEKANRGRTFMTGDESSYKTAVPRLADALLEAMDELADLRGAINTDGSLIEHAEFVDLARDGAAALGQVNRMATELAERDKAIGELARMLDRYGAHAQDCEINRIRSADNPQCNCGLAIIFASPALQAALKEKPR